MKNYPTFKADMIPEDRIDNFQKKGEIGWVYLTQQILQGSEAI